MKPGEITRVAFLDTETLSLESTVWEAAVILADLTVDEAVAPVNVDGAKVFLTRRTITVTDTWVGFIDIDEALLRRASPDSLRINRFLERHPRWRAPLAERREWPAIARTDDPGDEGVAFGTYWGRRDPDCLVWDRKAAGYELQRLLAGRTVVGAVPWFDTGKLGDLVTQLVVHYHLIDVEPLLAGKIAGEAIAKGLPVPAACLPPYRASELTDLAGIVRLDETAHEAWADCRWNLDVVAHVWDADVVWPERAVTRLDDGDWHYQPGPYPHNEHRRLPADQWEQFDDLPVTKDYADAQASGVNGWPFVSPAQAAQAAVFEPGAQVQWETTGGPRSGVIVDGPAADGSYQVATTEQMDDIHGSFLEPVRTVTARAEPAFTPLDETPDLNATGPVVPDYEAGVWRPWRASDDPQEPATHEWVPDPLLVHKARLAVADGSLESLADAVDILGVGPADAEAIVNAAAEPPAATPADIRAARGGLTGPVVMEEIDYGEGAHVEPPGNPSRQVVGTVDAQLADRLDRACAQAGIEFDSDTDRRQTLVILGRVVEDETADQRRHTEALTADYERLSEAWNEVLGAAFPDRKAPRISWAADARDLRDAYEQLKAADVARRQPPTPIPAEARE